MNHATEDALAHPAWIEKMFRAIDTCDAAAFTPFLTEDVSFRFGNIPAVKGNAAVGAFVQGFFGTLGGLRHQVNDVIVANDVVVAEGHVTYTRKDGSTLQVPFANVMRTRGEQVHDYLIFIDTSKL